MYGLPITPDQSCRIHGRRAARETSSSAALFSVQATAVAVVSTSRLRALLLVTTEGTR